MKTPDAIKKGIACCAEASPGACEHCPYVNDCEDFGACKLPRDALAYINQLEARVPKWISVENEQKPKHGELVLCIYVFDACPGRYVGTLNYYAYGDNGYVAGAHFSDEGMYGMRVTHWMPIPEIPKEE